MKSIPLDRVLWLAALPVLACGAAMTIVMASGIREHSSRIEHKLESYHKLLALSAEIGRRESAVTALEEMFARPVTRPSETANKISPLQFDVRRLQKEINERWTLMQEEISFRSAPLRDVMPLIAEMETESAPWRLARCSITAVAEGQADVVLLMQTALPIDRRHGDGFQR